MESDPPYGASPGDLGESQTTFIIDQAYVALTEDMLKPSDVKTHKNLILVQSISVYNIPGLRIGYLVASPEIAEKTSISYLGR